MNLRIDLGTVTMACGHTVVLRVPAIYGLCERDVRAIREQYERRICNRCEMMAGSLVMRGSEEAP